MKVEGWNKRWVEKGRECENTENIKKKKSTI
jgi:hypothetical protein